MRVGGAFSSDSKPSAGGPGCRAVVVDDVVGERDRMIARDVDAVPLIAVDRIVDDVMRSAVGVDEADAVTTVGMNQVIDDQGAGIAAIDRNPAVARAAAIVENSIELDVNILVLVVTAKQRYGLTSGPRNS